MAKPRTVLTQAVPVYVVGFNCHLFDALTVSSLSSSFQIVRFATEMVHRCLILVTLVLSFMALQATGLILTNDQLPAACVEMLIVILLPHV